MDEQACAASELGLEPQPGLALLRLAQGRTDAACAAIRRLTHATSDRVRRAGLLPAYLEIMLATGDLDEAREARHELGLTRRKFGLYGVVALFTCQSIAGLGVHRGAGQSAVGRLALERSACVPV